MSCFNPRRPRGRRRNWVGHRKASFFVSIHAARAGGDVDGLANPGTVIIVSIHAARAGGDESRSSSVHESVQFQSTPPARAATACAWRRLRCRLRVSIHAARAGGDVSGSRSAATPAVSIHAARAGGDVTCSSTIRRCATFQSTPPARAATTRSASIGAVDACFNPRRPRGRRRTVPARIRPRYCFNPRRPRGRRPYATCSIEPSKLSFNPRRPRGRRHRNRA